MKGREFGLINRQQQQVIEFQNAQIRILMDKLGKKRILLTNDQRRTPFSVGIGVSSRQNGITATGEMAKQDVQLYQKM